MKAIRIIKLKISSTTKADRLLVKWLRAANWLSKIVFKTKELNSNRLSNAHYAQLRMKGLPSQLACSLCKTVCATYKTAKANKRWELAKFKRAVMPIVWKRDFNRTRKGITLWGELLTIQDSRPLPESFWKDSKLKRVGDQWYLLLAYEVELAETKSTGSIVGVDFGIKRLMVATNSANSKTFFFKGGRLNHRRSSIRRARAAIQAVGTRSSHRLLQRISGNEAAVTGNMLHCASKALVAYAVANDARRIVLEDLSNVRDASLSKGQDLRSKVHRWPYAEARFKIEYKAAAEGIETEVVSPKNTSRGCSVCGHVAASNRKGLRFHCGKCGHQEDADRQASKNIRLRSISIEHNSAEMGSLQSPESSEPPEINSGMLLHNVPAIGLGSRLNPRTLARGS